jgi:serine protease inhibitor
VIRDISSNLKSRKHLILRDVNDIRINAVFHIKQSRFNTCQYRLSVGISTVIIPNPSVDVMNRRIAGATDGMIPAAPARDSIKADTAFLITNDFHFHGEWATNFKSTNSAWRDFHALTRQTSHAGHTN